ncbi:hypothetical protein ACFQVA_33215 [Actinomadura keratinilytica]
MPDAARDPLPGGNLVLDSERLAKAVLRDLTVIAWLTLAHTDGLCRSTSASTLVEVVHAASTARPWSGHSPASSWSRSPN